MVSLNRNPRMRAQVAGLSIGYGSSKRGRESIFVWPASAANIDAHSQIRERARDSQERKGFCRRSSSPQVHTVAGTASRSDTSGGNARGENDREINLIRLSSRYAIISAETPLHKHDQSVGMMISLNIQAG